MARFSKRKQKDYRRQHYISNKKKALEEKQLNYKSNADIRKKTDTDLYQAGSAHKKQIVRAYYTINSGTIKSAKRSTQTP